MNRSNPLANDRAPVAAILYALPDERKFLSDGYEALTIVREKEATRIAPELDRNPAKSAVVSLRIGVGPENAYRNTALLLDSGHSVGAVVIVGFAGGLDTDLRPGSVTIGETVTDVLTGRAYSADAALVCAASKIALEKTRIARGCIAATDRVLVLASEKREFARSTGAVAVDMESAGAAAAAAEYGVPWLAVRVITDGVDDDLPFDFNARAFQAPEDPYGGVDRGRIVSSTLTHPWKIPALIRLGVRSSLAARNLAAFLHAFLPTVPLA